MSRRTARSPRILALALAVAGTLVVGACSDSDGEEGRAPATEGPTTTGSGSPSTEPGTTDPTHGVDDGAGPHRRTRRVLRLPPLRRLRRAPRLRADRGPRAGRPLRPRRRLGLRGRRRDDLGAGAHAARNDGRRRRRCQRRGGDGRRRPGSSGTNTQEAGVDEGDLVENDGQRVYSVVDGRLRIVDVRQRPGAGVGDAARRPAPAAARRQPTGGDDVGVGGPRRDGRVGVRRGRPGRAGAARAHPPRGRGHRRAGGRGHGSHRAVVAVRAASGARAPDGGDADSEDEAEAENRRIITESSAEDWLPRILHRSAQRQHDGARRRRSTAPPSAIPPSSPASGWCGWRRCRWPARTGAGTGLTATGSAGVVSSGGIAYASATTALRGHDPLARGRGRHRVRPNRPTPPTTAIHAFDLDGGGAPRTWPADRCRARCSTSSRCRSSRAVCGWPSPRRTVASATPRSRRCACSPATATC